MQTQPRTGQRVEFLAKQLFNVMQNKAKELAPGEPTETWDSAPDDLRQLFMAQADYVLGTYEENSRLRARVRVLEGQLKLAEDGRLRP